MVCLILMVFASLIFTEFIVLYCCGLEYNTHLEINNRSISYENLNSGIMDDDDDNDYVDEKINDKRELLEHNKNKGLFL